MESLNLFTDTEKNHAEPSQICVHQGWFEETKRFFEQNWRHCVVQQRMNEQKKEVLQTDKLNCVCCFTRRRNCGLQGRSFTRISAQKSHGF